MVYGSKFTGLLSIIDVSSISDKPKRDTKTVLISYSVTPQIALSKYIKGVSMMSAAPAREYRSRLESLGTFITVEYKITSDDLIMGITEGLLNPYDVE